MIVKNCINSSMDLKQEWKLYREQNMEIDRIRSILQSDTEVLTEESWIQKLFSKLKNLFSQKKPVDIDVKSEAISHFHYDPRSKILRLTFTKNDRTYAYRNVDEKSVFRLLASTNNPNTSIGKEFHRNVRPNSNRFPYREVSY
jgi:DNA topoisomerase VI subunit A